MIFKLLNSFAVIISLWGLIIFSSIFPFIPWHEGSGVQFAVVPAIIMPVLVLLGLVLGVVRGMSKNPKSISICHVINPVVTGLILGMIVLIARGPAYWMPVIGTMVCFISIAVSATSVIRVESNA